MSKVTIDSMPGGFVLTCDNQRQICTSMEALIEKVLPALMPTGTSYERLLEEILVARKDKMNKGFKKIQIQEVS